ncbi:MAG: right-handed parallel beta-helix repeat-containing protein, partial [Phycisphaerales bacterium]|nr:right-handed parallel beta-helix repeat-containing protein [Phycisphaerales bacterium]
MRVIAWLSVLVLAGVCRGETYTVNQDGSGDFTSIQQAIGSVSDGSIIEVAPGTYVENINFIGKAITLRSADGAEATIIRSNTDAGGVWAITCQQEEGSDTIIDGFTVQTHTGSKGLYVYLATPTVRNCKFHGDGNVPDSEAIYAAGGSFAQEGQVMTVSRCEFVNQKRAFEYFATADIILDSCQFHSIETNDTLVTLSGNGKQMMRNCNVTDCAFTSTQACALQLYQDCYQVELNNCRFESIAGRTLRVDGYSCSTELSIRNCVFQNINTDNAPSIELDHSDHVIFSSCLFAENTVKSGGDGMVGIYEGVTEFYDCEFTSNSQHLSDSSRGAVVIDESAYEVTFRDCTFESNDTDGTGGAVYANGTYVKFEACDFTANEADYGGALYFKDCVGDISGCSFEQNLAAFGGGAMEVNGTSNVNINFSAIRNNSASNSPGGGGILCTPNTVTLYYSAVCNNTPDDISGDFINAGGNDFGKDCSNPDSLTVAQDGSGNFSQVQSAINTAIDGITIDVGPGIYTENIDFLGKAIVLRSTDGPDVTTIQGDGTDRVVRMDNGEPEGTRLEGFTVTGGNGGVSISRNASPSIVDCVISGNVYEMTCCDVDGGGGIRIDVGASSSTVEISDCVISNNEVSYDNEAYGGGIMARSGWYFYDPDQGSSYGNSFLDLTINNTVVANNTAYYASGIGYVTENRCCEEGYLGSISITSTNCTIQDNVTGNQWNSAAFYAGHNLSELIGPVSITNINCTISNNEGGGCYFSTNGGGDADVDDLTFTVVNEGCTFTGNTGINSPGLRVFAPSNVNSSVVNRDC